MIHNNHKVLECHSQGDRRYSAYYAYIVLLGKKESIERIYQTSKVINGYQPDCIKDGRGKTPTSWRIRGIDFDLSYSSIFYQTLWVLYFTHNKDLYDYACQFDEFHDKFSQKGHLNQAETIKRIVRLGLDVTSKECYPFMDELYKKWKRG